MTLPTFLVIGAMKAGTSSLHRYVGAHPDIFVPDEKEPDFFLGGPAWERGQDWYEGLFERGAGARARGEASTRYSKDPIFPGVPGRAARVVPEARLVYVLRHPVERILSHHRHAVAEWGHPASLEEALRASRGEYLVPTRYAHQMECWLEHFPREQLLVVTSEDLDAQRAPTLGRVFSFLGVDPDWRPSDLHRRYNQAGDHRVPSPAAQGLRQARIYRALKRRVPKRVRHAAWLASSTPSPPPEPAASSDVEGLVLPHLLPDLQRLSELLPGFDCWGLLDGGRRG